MTNKFQHRCSLLFTSWVLALAGLIIFSWVALADIQMPLARIAGKNLVKIEVASTQAEIERGLMYRTSLPAEAGMVFLFNPPRPVKFWMYHTLIPLDMLFVLNGRIVKICSDVPPCRSESPSDCPTYPEGSTLLASHVIELNAGYARHHGIKEGDTVSFELPSPTAP